MVCLRADLNYQQGLNRQFNRRTRLDYYWPDFAHLGEQAIPLKELLAKGTNAIPPTDENTFGYQERHAEYRYSPNQIHGRFRSNALAPLDSWHLAQQLTGTPLLNSTFIQENPPMDRILAVADEPDILFDSHVSMRHARRMPVYGVPGFGARF